MENSNKDFDLVFRGDYIHVTLGPDYEISPAQESHFWAAIEDACKKYNCNRILVDGYIPKRVPEPREIVESGMRAAAVAPRLWFALCLEGYEMTELGELFKTVARSHGVHVKFFSDHDQARAWLRSNPAE
jgi:hypothetical protein